jgi:uncharacterized protein YodC (DUF2158 family)
VPPKDQEANMAFRVGDVVQLRHGSGTRMRVEKTEMKGANEWVTCVWGAENECHNYFVAEMLQKVAPSIVAKRAPPGARSSVIPGLPNSTAMHANPNRTVRRSGAARLNSGMVPRSAVAPVNSSRGERKGIRRSAPAWRRREPSLMATASGRSTRRHAVPVRDIHRKLLDERRFPGGSAHIALCGLGSPSQSTYHCEEHGEEAVPVR